MLKSLAEILHGNRALFGACEKHDTSSDTTESVKLLDLFWCHMPVLWRILRLCDVRSNHGASPEGLPFGAGLGRREAQRVQGGALVGVEGGLSGLRTGVQRQ